VDGDEFDLLCVKCGQPITGAEGVVEAENGYRHQQCPERSWKVRTGMNYSEILKPGGDALANPPCIAGVIIIQQYHSRLISL